MIFKLVAIAFVIFAIFGVICSKISNENTIEAILVVLSISSFFYFIVILFPVLGEKLKVPNDSALLILVGILCVVISGYLYFIGIFIAKITKSISECISCKKTKQQSCQDVDDSCCPEDLIEDDYYSDSDIHRFIEDDCLELKSNE